MCCSFKKETTIPTPTIEKALHVTSTTVAALQQTSNEKETQVDEKEEQVPEEQVELEEEATIDDHDSNVNCYC